MTNQSSSSGIATRPGSSVPSRPHSTSNGTKLAATSRMATTAGRCTPGRWRPSPCTSR